MKTIINAVLCSLLAFFAPIQGVSLLVGVSILADTIMGLYAAKKSKDKIISDKLKWGLIGKMFAYELTVLMIYAIEILLLEDITSMVLDIHLIVTKIAALTLVSIEAFSIDESWRKINNGKGVAFYFSRLIKLGKTVKDAVPKREE